MKRKICTIGNSQGIILPKEYLQTLGLSTGSYVEAVLDTEQKAIVLFGVREDAPPPGVSADFASRVKQFIDRNRKTLEALAK